MYSISLLIHQVIGADKKKKREFLKRIGYQNFNKGYRKLDHLMKHGECPPEIEKKLPSALNLPIAQVEVALQETVEQKKKEMAELVKGKKNRDRLEFKPHIYIETEKQPYQVGLGITLMAIVGEGKLKKIFLPSDIIELDWDEQKKIVRQEILIHQNNRGMDRIYGEVIHYVYRPAYMREVLFGPSGDLINVQFRDPTSSDVLLQVNGRFVNFI